LELKNSKNLPKLIGFLFEKEGHVRRTVVGRDIGIERNTVIILRFYFDCCEVNNAIAFFLN
jgi:hypothetical protein